MIFRHEVTTSSIQFRIKVQCSEMANVNIRGEPYRKRGRQVRRVSNHLIFFRTLEISPPSVLVLCWKEALQDKDGWLL
jgi:hypothetical protein